MHPLRRTSVAVAVSCGAGLLIGACMMPSEHSGDLRVVVSNAPSLMRVQDRAQLVANLVDASGATIPGAALRFVSVNTQVAQVDSTGLVTAIAAGSATVQVTSAAFAGAQSAGLSIRVVGVLAIDSVRPRTAKFGDLLQVYGVGLDSITGVTLGGVDAPVAGFTAINSARPDLSGALSVWVAPPAAAPSAVRVENGFTSATATDSVTVAQNDKYEPNDTAAVTLGTLTDSIFNPGLAFEERGNIPRVAVNAQTQDWYTFTTTSTQDVTVVLTAPPPGLVAAQVVLADSLALGGSWYDAGLGTARSVVPGPGRVVTTPAFEMCGTSFSANVFMTAYSLAGVPTESVVLPLRALPAGRHHLLLLYGDNWVTSEVPFGTRVIGYFSVPLPVTWSFAGYTFTPLAGYQLLVKPGYRSALPPDQFEPNNNCALAKAVTPPFSYAGLTMDSPGRDDWYKFTVSTAGPTYTFTLNGSVASADIDLYLYQSFLPDSVHLVDWSYSSTPNEQISDVLPVGSYFLVISDYAGIPTSYSLGSTAAAPIARAPVIARTAVPPQKLNAVRERIRMLVHPAGRP